LGVSLSLTGAQASPGKSVYLVADHHASPTPINAYGIEAGANLTYQATYNVTYHGFGASGLAMYEDPDGDGDLSDAQIFVTYEMSSMVEIFNAVDFSTVGNVTAANATDLAGIVVDQEKKLVYTVDRYSNQLYVYDANTFAPVAGSPFTLSGLSGSGAVGVALDETNDWLFVTDFDSTVQYYDTNNLPNIVGTITVASTNAIGIAVDDGLGFVYTGGAFWGDNLLCKLDMSDNSTTSVSITMGEGAMGLAVDIDTNQLYVTTGYGGDKLRVFDSNLNELWDSPYPDSEGMITMPAGIVIPRKEIEYGIQVPVDIKPTSCPNPLNTKSKGVLPVAILGTEDFDVTQIDPASVRLAEEVAPLRWSWEDVATPYEPFTGKETCDNCTTKGPDGYMDLTLKFKSQEVVAALGAVSDGECVVVELTGNLMEEYDGTPIVGEDVVLILKKE
jgi:hypothetical protein